MLSILVERCDCGECRQVGCRGAGESRRVGMRWVCIVVQDSVAKKGLRRFARSVEVGASGESTLLTPPELASRPVTALRSGDFGSAVLAWSLPVKGEGTKLFDLRGVL
jgi:hypothetical protein